MASLFPQLTDEDQRRLHAWLCLSVASLVGAGLFAALVALARTPGIQDLLPGGDYFRRALVGHVNLAVVVWFLAFQCALWTLAGDTVVGAGFKPAPAGWVGFWAAAVGAGTLIVPAFLGLGEPILSNYVPVLNHPTFLSGLLLFGAGMSLAAVHTVRTVLRAARPVSLIAFGSGITSGLVLLSLLCFGLAAVRLTSPHASPLTPHAFETLAWGGGHILQFANTAAMVLVWILLARLTLGAEKLPRLLDDRWAKRFVLFYLIIALPSPLFYLTEASDGLFTLLMATGLGPVTGIVGLAIVWSVLSRRRVRRGAMHGAPTLPWGNPGFSGLILSLALFALGGLIALDIRGSNVIIPAHYHAVIGAVTLAFMGISYRLLPLAGREIWSERLARMQPYLYGIGQTLFVLGLFWAGTRGVPRKTFGAAQVLHDPGQIIGMGLMGLGGLVAISGGIAFIVNMAPSLLKSSRNPKGLSPHAFRLTPNEAAWSGLMKEDKP